MIIDGKSIAENKKNQIKERLLKDKISRHLAVVTVGDDEASKVYVNNKLKASKCCGVDFSWIHLPNDTTQEELEDAIEELNNDDDITGIIVQLPLPSHLSDEVCNRILPEKDVDGFTDLNMGHLVNHGTNDNRNYPCTALGIMELIKSTTDNLTGKHAVIVGRSNIVGKPIAMMLLEENCTVTITHSKTENLKEITKQADILVVAIGKPEFITADYVKDGAIVIDVGINRTENELKGDVKFDEVTKKVKAITPVPGGVGPMTVAMLMENIAR